MEHIRELLEKKVNRLPCHVGSSEQEKVDVVGLREVK